MSKEEQVISSPADYFESNSYVLLDGVISKEFCEELTKRLFELYDSGQMVKDEQCPKSDSIYGDPVFDSLLEKFADPVGKHINKELIPTYTYARIYRKGEVLERHTDRPACEISGTMTLGCDGRHIWPIYVADSNKDKDGKRIDLAFGDILMYRGEELPHWRPVFKGQWQCQVFFHYVDANGPHAETEAFDGRPQLGLSAGTKGMAADEVEPQPTVVDTATAEVIQKGEQEVTKKRDGVFPIYNGVMIPSWDLTIPGVTTVTKTTYPSLAFTDEECDKIIGLASDAYADDGGVGAGKEGIINKDIRNVNLYLLPLEDDTKWIFDRIARAVSIVNAEYYDFEIMGITHQLQLLHYESGDDPGHYNWHMDIGGSVSSTRKISVSVQLSDPSTYTGGELTINANGEDNLADLERGIMCMFPSYCMHRVSPMKTGERWALVIWVHGSKRFR